MKLSGRLRVFSYLILLAGLILFLPAWATAAKAKTTPQTQNTSAVYGVHENCLSCHSIKGLQGTLPGGEKVPLYVSGTNVQHLFIGENGVAECERCHTDYLAYPHQEDPTDEINRCELCHPPDSVASFKMDFAKINFTLPYANRREMSLSLNNGCSNCHEDIVLENKDSTHSQLVETGNPLAPMCVDCHGGHDISSPNEPREKISATCANCHPAVNSTYEASVHGEALSKKSNKDVPTCVDCHGVHSVQGPHNQSFRNDSITLCGGCHGDEALMSKYGISTNVLDSYLDDFHGRSVDLFRTSSVARPSNQAVCYDCHGIHNILPADDPHSTVYPENLQATCQKCHVDADIQFPDAWLSHYAPELETYPLLFIVDLVYPILIWGTLGGMSVYIALDAKKRWAEYKENKS